MNLLEELKKLDVNDEVLLKEYVIFCKENDVGRKMKGVENHHILPKTLFQEFEDLKIFPENSVFLKYKDHLEAHRLLHECVENDSITLAFNIMNNLRGIDYPEFRKEVNEIISRKMKGKVVVFDKKSGINKQVSVEEYASDENLVSVNQGRKASEVTKEKLKKRNLDGSYSKRMKEMRKGKCF